MIGEKCGISSGGKHGSGQAIKTGDDNDPMESLHIFPIFSIMGKERRC